MTYLIMKKHNQLMEQNCVMITRYKSSWKYDNAFIEFEASQFMVTRPIH